MNERTGGKAPADPTLGTPAVLRRSCACAGRDDGCARCNGAKPATLQRSARADGTAPMHAPPLVHQVLESNGQPLDAATRAYMKPRFQHDFSGVRVHADARAAESARAVDAKAYTVGNHIVFGHDQHRPDTHDGRRLLAHELAHVVQQGSRPLGVQAKIAVGSASDASEVAADRAADAVMEGRRASLVPTGTPTLRRQSAGGPGHIDLRPRPEVIFAPPLLGNDPVVRVDRIDDNRRMVHLRSGRQVQVIRRHEVTTRERTRSAPRVHGDVDFDADRLWFEVDWCSGANEGVIKLGADIPAQVLNLLLNAVSSGRGLEGALEQASLTPFIEADMRFGRWRVTAGGQTTVDRSGDVTDARGRVGVETDTRRGRISVRVEAGSERVGTNPLGGVQGRLVIEWAPDAPPRPRCETTKVEFRHRTFYECREPDTPPSQRTTTRQVPHQDRLRRTVFFHYDRATIDEARSREALERLLDDVRSGYRITDMIGYTSPEGTQSPSPGFQGNDPLADKRARTLERYVREACARERNDNCFADGARIGGGGEQHTLIDPQTGRETGTARDPGRSRQARHAMEEYERQHGTPAPSAGGSARPRTDRERAEPTYAALRTVEVALVRARTVTQTQVEQVPGVPGREVMGGCPRELIRSAFPQGDRSTR